MRRIVLHSATNGDLLVLAAVVVIMADGQRLPVR